LIREKEKAMSFEHCIPPRVSVLTVVLLSGLSVAGQAVADRGVRARLSGYQEVPVVSTVGTGEFRGKIDKDTGEIDYEFSYSGMQGMVTQAHIHLAQRGVNGGIVVWLCRTTQAAPEGTPLCGSPDFESSGRITAASVVAANPGQQFAAGELAELGKALRAGVAYVNVHTDLSPGGEIRGQIDHRH
jgi:hypothetical protein